MLQKRRVTPNICLFTVQMILKTARLRCNSYWTQVDSTNIHKLYRWSTVHLPWPLSFVWD